MTRYKRKRARQPAFRPTPHEFAAALAENEAHMAEMAAFSITCDQFGISETTGYELLVRLPDFRP